MTHVIVFAWDGWVEATFQFHFEHSLHAATCVCVCVCQPSASFSCRILVTAMESQVHHSCDARDASHAWVLVNPSLDIWTETD